MYRSLNSEISDNEVSARDSKPNNDADFPALGDKSVAHRRCSETGQGVCARARAEVPNENSSPGNAETVEIRLIKFASAPISIRQTSINCTGRRSSIKLNFAEAHRNAVVSNSLFSRLPVSMTASKYGCQRRRTPSTCSHHFPPSIMYLHCPKGFHSLPSVWHSGLKA